MDEIYTKVSLFILDFQITIYYIKNVARELLKFISRYDDNDESVVRNT